MQDEGVQYTELFEVIRAYSGLDIHHQHKALSLITDNYTPFNNLPMDESRSIVESILKSHNYLFWYGGRPSLAGIDTVIAVARWGGHTEWGIQMLWRIVEALVDEGRSQSAGDESTISRSSNYADEIQSVLTSLNNLRGS